MKHVTLSFTFLYFSNKLYFVVNFELMGDSDREIKTIIMPGYPKGVGAAA
jgi:hypothetical protein